MKDRTVQDMSGQYRWGLSSSTNTPRQPYQAAA
jgi:hypothetical protein